MLLLRERLAAQPASLPQIRHAATAALVGSGIADRKFLGGVALALSEAVGNVIQHAYPNGTGDIDVSMLSGDQEIVITVADTGVGIDDAADSSGLGVGLQLISRISTTWTVSSDAGGTAITMRFASPAR